MELICAKFKELHTEDKLKHLPNFAIITNGTIFNQKILSFLKNNISIITVSIDGPKEINDYNRIHINGKGTFNEISKFIRTIKTLVSTFLVDTSEIFYECYSFIICCCFNFLFALFDKFLVRK